MFALCSAACKALRFASTALAGPNAAAALGAPGARPSGLDAACGQLVDWQLRDGQSCEAARINRLGLILFLCGAILVLVRY